MLTADYAFGHDLFRVSSPSSRRRRRRDGQRMVPTDTPDYSAYISKIVRPSPTSSTSILDGSDRNAFLKQYRQSGLMFRWPAA